MFPSVEPAKTVITIRVNQCTKIQCRIIDRDTRKKLLSLKASVASDVCARTIALKPIARLILRFSHMIIHTTTTPKVNAMSTPLAKEFQFYLENQEALVGQYNGKVIVIVGTEIVGVYDDEMTAVNQSKKKHPLGSFLVQAVAPGKGSYTQTFHSRVAFA